MSDRSSVQRFMNRKNVHIGGAMGVFFGLKLLLGLALIGASSRFLPVSGFVIFSQLFLFYALLATLSAAGVQNGLVRQIALAGGSIADERRAVAAALRIWLVASVTMIVAVVALRLPLSRMLVGDGSVADIVPLLTLLAAIGGLGVLACAVLNGRRRPAASLLLQSAGLIVGGTACLWQLVAGDGTGAVIGYAAGPLVTGVLAAAIVWRSGIGVRVIGDARAADIRLLLAYSLVFLLIAVLTPSTLFALRHFYREDFGVDLLGYWLAANRTSDVTSQILGLYMAQIFLPRITQERDGLRSRRVIIQTFLLGSAVMLGGWLLFVAASRFFVESFLSAAYLPAIPFIGGYLLGDALRVSASIGTHLMLARARLATAVAIEGGAAALFAAYLAGFAAAGRPEAPYWAYPAAYATMALVLMACFARAYRTTGHTDFEGRA